MAGNMDIREALSQLYAVEGALAITDPITTNIKKVWHYRPPSNKTITDTPCITNLWTAPTLEFRSGVLTGEFEINLQLLVWDADSDQAADIAAAFYKPVIEALSANIKLGLSGWTVRRLRGGENTLRVFGDESDVAGKTFIGLDLFIDLYSTLGAVNAAGSPP